MSKTPLQQYLDRENKKQEKENTPQPAQKQQFTLQHFLIAVWVAIWIACSIWVGYGNPKEDCFYAMFWGGFISFMIVMTLSGCIARIWLAWHTPEIIENIYRGLSSRK